MMSWGHLNKTNDDEQFNIIKHFAAVVYKVVNGSSVLKHDVFIP